MDYLKRILTLFLLQLIQEQLLNSGQVRGGGLEPPMTGPEPVVLPITPSPIGCTPKSRQVRVPRSLESTNRLSAPVKRNLSVCRYPAFVGLL